MWKLSYKKYCGIMFMVSTTLSQISDGDELSSRTTSYLQPNDDDIHIPADDEIISLTHDKNHKPKFIYPGLIHVAETYNPNSQVVHGYHPWKTDLSGMLIGGVVGLGSILLIPRLMNLLIPEIGAYGQTYNHHFGYDYRRQDIFANSDISHVQRLLTDNLGRLPISECVQKFICSMVQSSAQTFDNYHNNQILDEDHTLNRLLKNDVINFAIDGSKFKSAMLKGKSNVSCSQNYPICPLSEGNILSGIEILMKSKKSILNHQ